MLVLVSSGDIQWCKKGDAAQMNQIKDNPNKAESRDKIFKSASPTQVLRQNKNKTSF